MQKSIPRAGDPETGRSQVKASLGYRGRSSGGEKWGKTFKAQRTPALEYVRIG